MYTKVIALAPKDIMPAHDMAGSLSTPEGSIAPHVLQHLQHLLLHIIGIIIATVTWTHLSPVQTRVTPIFNKTQRGITAWL